MTIHSIQPDYLPRRINRYVPAMKYAADVVMNAPVAFSLGTPKVADADGILNDKSATDSAKTYDSSDFETTFDGSATSLTTTAGKMDATYGRNVTLTGTAGSNHVVTISGRDYLGQPMKENLTLSGTTVIVGNKAFKYIDGIAVAAGAASDTFDMGWGSKLGLPYKLGALLGAIENDIEIAPHEQLVYSPLANLTVSGANAHTVVAPIDGDIVAYEYEVTTAVTVAASTLDAVINGSGVAGLDVVVPIAAIGFGLRVPFDLGDASIAKGQSAVWTSDSGATAGVIRARAAFSKPYGSYDDADKTDPATATTQDPRGTYTPYTTMDGTKEIKVIMEADNEVNSSGNGGLHGISQYFA